ncbi:MAG TPA: hypothetical protein VLF18_12520 [Tahibacter sp.]|uniref:hypothetical protein n=1 Tax=Tahibacter sp. TaxID=2056211 RepID=UPI002C78246D|nr:hypothetical protein [Tahibacter sp.]HSX61019.1 hypothetical protein [Tahibacter sp.]
MKDRFSHGLGNRNGNALNPVAVDDTIFSAAPTARSNLEDDAIVVIAPTSGNRTEALSLSAGDFQFLPDAGQRVELVVALLNRAAGLKQLDRIDRVFRRASLPTFSPTSSRPGSSAWLKSDRRLRSAQAELVPSNQNRPPICSTSLPSLKRAAMAVTTGPGRAMCSLLPSSLPAPDTPRRRNAAHSTVTDFARFRG